jgi:transcriptional regulator with XRE-family HTH domain
MDEQTRKNEEEEFNSKVDRIKKLIKELGQTSSAFAENIKVNPATITHILTGRNKLSLDVFEKILDAFPKINPDWLLSGKTPIYRHEKAILHTTQPDLFENQSVNTDKTSDSEYSLKKGLEKPEIPYQQPKQQEFKPEIVTAKKINKIIIFYSDNTFMNFSPEK